MIAGQTKTTPAAWARVDPWRKSVWLALSLVGAGVLVLLVLNMDQLGSDARSYWRLGEHPYTEGTGNLSTAVAFRYAPPLALLLAPLSTLSWPWFLSLWFLGALTALALVSGRWTLAMIALYPVALELSALNIHLWLALALVVGLRFPAAWSLLPLTKATPIVCWVWFAVRREWRNLAIVVATTLALCLGSFLLAPHLWPEWIAMLISDIGAPAGVSVPVPLWIRLPLAVAVTIYAARTDRSWLLPVALLLSIPTIWPQSLAVLVGTVPLLRANRSKGDDELAGLNFRHGDLQSAG